VLMVLFRSIKLFYIDLCDDITINIVSITHFNLAVASSVFMKTQYTSAMGIANLRGDHVSKTRRAAPLMHACPKPF